jgi:hypothetical protein
MPRKRKSEVIYSHVFGYRADEEMFNNINADIKSNRIFGIRNPTDVIHAALTERYTKENFWDSITRRLDRQKSQLQVLDMRFKRLEEMLVTFFQYYFTQFPEFDDSEKSQARLRSNIAFNRFLKVLQRKLEADNYTLREIENRIIEEDKGGKA